MNSLLDTIRRECACRNPASKIKLAHSGEFYGQKRVTSAIAGNPGRKEGTAVHVGNFAESRTLRTVVRFVVGDHELPGRPGFPVIALFVPLAAARRGR
jgi:hypothetical protein